MILCSFTMFSYVDRVKDVPIFMHVVYLALVNQDVPIFICIVYLAFSTIYVLIWFMLIWPYLLVDLLCLVRTDLSKQIVYFYTLDKFRFQDHYYYQTIMTWPESALLCQWSWSDRNRPFRADDRVCRSMRSVGLRGLSARRARLSAQYKE